MKTTDPSWSQLVLDSDQSENQLLMADVDAYLAKLPEPKMTPWLQFKLVAGRALHFIGLHHFVPMRVFDENTRLVINSTMVTCMWCPAVRDE